MTISKNGAVISLSVNRKEFDKIYAAISNSKIDCSLDLANVMEGYYQTYDT